MKKYHFGFIVVIYLFSLILYLSFYYSPEINGVSQTMVIQPGLTNRVIAKDFKKNGLIISPVLFLAFTFLSDQGQLIAGNYRFQTGETISQIVNKIAQGHFYQIKVTFPEGSTAKQMAEWLEQTGICRQEDYLNLTQQPTVFQKPWLSEAKNLEGYLFPDTYYLSPGTDPKRVIEIQLNRFEEIYPGNLLEESFTEMNKKVILASIVEREARVKNEKPIVASVFLNRLKMNMKLESCATVIYAWNQEKGIQLSSLSLDDLTLPSPYNTYLHQGLPPTPICNPGLDSLKAVANPPQTNYYFFVLGENGSHYFSKTFEEHLKNKKKSGTQ
ncbi:MAG: endolytic transglycosylase MltG [Candidatus Atribacteria bacterium]|nr:endolytic transglycosylase MltG [Candidatus Atribacteria bacterium]